MKLSKNKIKDYLEDIIIIIQLEIISKMMGLLFLIKWVKLKKSLFYEDSLFYYFVALLLIIGTKI